MKHMNRYGLRWLFVGCCGLLCALLFGVPIHAVESPTGLWVGQLQVFEDPSAQMTLAEIQAQGTAFQELGSSLPNYGFTASAYWFRMPVKNQLAAVATYYVDIKNTNLDHATLFVVSEGQVQATVKSGDRIAAQSRPYLATTLVLPFQLQPGASATLYLQTSSLGGPLFVPLTIANELTVQQETRFHLALGSAILGLLGGLFVYNLFIFSILRSRLYLYYVLFLPFIVMTAVGSGGFGSAYLYPNNTWLGNDGIGVVLGISLAYMILFTQEFLQTRTYPRLHRLLNVLVIGGFVISVGVFFWNSRFGHQLTMVVLFLYPLICVFMGIIALRRGNTAARFYIVGQAATWCSMIGYALLSTGVLPYHILLYESPTIGLACDALLLSLALADRIRILQRERVAAEEQARRNLEIRSDELEQLVAKRTAEIKTLHGILPICANCKKIRDDDGAWQQLEAYISQHTDAAFSHGICSDCMEKLYPELLRKRGQQLTS